MALVDILLHVLELHHTMAENQTVTAEIKIHELLFKLRNYVLYVDD